MVADNPIGDQMLLGFVGDQVAGRFAGIDAQAGDAPGVVVIEHEPGALLVGIAKGLTAVAGCRTVRYTGDIPGGHIRNDPHCSHP